MAEDLSDPNAQMAEMAVEEAPLTYHDVLASHPDMPQELREHVERLAVEEAGAGAHVGSTELVKPAYVDSETTNQETIDSKHLLPEHAASEEETAYSAAEVLQRYTQELRSRKRNTSEDPSPYIRLIVRPPAFVIEALQSGEFTDDELAAFVRDGRQLCDKFCEMGKQEPAYASPNPIYGGLLKSIQQLPLDRLRLLYQSDEFSTDLKYMLSNVTDQSSQYVSADLIKDVYGYEDVLDLFEPWGAISHDPIVEALSKQKHLGEGLLSALNKSTIRWPEGGDQFLETMAKRDWAERYLRLMVSLPGPLRNELRYDSYSRTMNQNTSNINTDQLISMLATVTQNVEHLGMERVLELRERAGIVSLDYYSDSQLMMTSDVIRGDEKAIKHLQEGDVTVLFTDARGDYNGAFKYNAYKFGSDANRTLCFEITKPSDFHRYMAMLHRRGIKPSTLVFSAHGNPGFVGVGSGRGKFEIVNGMQPDGTQEQKGKVLHIMEEIESRVLQRVVADMMQDSKGIDDNPEAKGRRRIILASCSQAKKVDALRFNDEQPMSQIDQLNHMLSKVKDERGATFVRESSAETLVKSAAHQNLDVFASDESFAVNVTEDGKGVQFDLVIEDARGKEVRVPHPTTQLRLAADGSVIAREIEYIALRPKQKDDNLVNASTSA